MKPTRIAALSFLAGSIVAGTSVYFLKPKREAITERDLAFLNKKMAESSFPALRTAKWQAKQAIAFFESRKDEAKTVELCSLAITEYLAAIQSASERGDLYFMADALERDRDEALKFMAANPQLKQLNKEANQQPEPTSGLRPAAAQH
jgi:hypothetical protein